MGESRSAKCMIFMTILTVFVGIALKLYINKINKNDLMNVIKSMENIELMYDEIQKKNRSLRIAVGFGGCTDIFSRAISCFKNLNMSGPIASDVNKTDKHELNSLDDINREFSEFFVEGAAAERYVQNDELFEMIHKSVSSLTEITQIKLGGNAPVMSNRMAQDGATILLGSKLSANQISFLHPNVSVVDVMPSSESEDRHVILEFNVGEQWGSLICPRANRYIIHRDRHSPFLTGLDELKKSIGDFNADMFVLGGLQLMDSFPYKSGQMQLEINKLEDFLIHIPKEMPIHFEMASFIDKDFFLMLKNQIIPYADSLGFNEQELPNLFSVLKSDSITTMSSAFPRTSQMLDYMRQVWEMIVDRPQISKTPRFRLSRLHLHTIGYQIIMTNKHSEFWHSSRSAVVKASLVAYKYTCGIQNIDIDRSKLLMDDSFSISGVPNSPRVHFNFTDPVSCWEEREIEICIAPVLVCTKVIKTVGGGDNISAAALLNQRKTSP